MIAARWREDLKRREGERVYLDALRDYATGNLGHGQQRLIWVKALAILILTTPMIFVALGLALILSALPSLGGVFFGGILIGTGYFLFPTRYRLPKDALTRGDAPVLFKQLDEVTASLDAPSITRVVVDEELNAFAVQTRRYTVLGIGALLWELSTPAERLALVGHEVGHLVNNDPARGLIVRWAVETLDRWDDLLSPDVQVADNVIGEILMWPVRLLAAVLNKVLLRPMFLESQRAEYLADALAAKVSGKQAVTSLLNTLSLSDLLQKDWNRLHLLNDVKGRAVLHRLVAGLAKLDPERRQEKLDQVKVEKLSVDATHPPSAYRIAFVETIPMHSVPLDSTLFATDDPALVKRFDIIGERLATRFEAQ